MCWISQLLQQTRTRSMPEIVSYIELQSTTVVSLIPSPNFYRDEKCENLQNDQ